MAARGAYAECSGCSGADRACASGGRSGRHADPACEKKRDNYYRCEGPLQVTYSDLVSANGRTSLGEACGTRRTPPRDMGMAGGFRIFGCGFGIHPTLRDYPGNRDVPAEYGLYIADRATFYCPRSTDAYCRGH